MSQERWVYTQVRGSKKVTEFLTEASLTPQTALVVCEEPGGRDSGASWSATYGIFYIKKEDTSDVKEG